MSADAGRAASPCIRLCRLDPASGHCLGCGRTMNEIASWASYDDAARTQVLTRLPSRLAALATRSPAG